MRAFILVFALANFSSCGQPTARRNESESKSLSNRVNCDIDRSSLQIESLKGIPIEDRGIDRSEKIRHLNEIAKLPDLFLNRLRQTNFSIQLTRNSITDFPKFARWKGVTPRGWPAGTSYSNVPGTGYPEAVYLGNSALPNNAYSLAIHEISHSLDAIANLQSRGDVKYAFRLERAHPSDHNGSYRYSSIAEFIAVGLDEYFCSKSTRATFAAQYPKTFQFFANQLPKLLR
jgi:hypothetical protein